METFAHGLSFDAVYAEHARFVWRAVVRLGVASEHADDVVQEVFLVVHRRLAEFRQEASVRTWLYAIAVRVSRNHRRSQARRRLGAGGEPLDDEVAESRATDEGRGPDALFEEAEARAIASELLGELAAEQREVFVLAELEGLSVPEIADIVAANPNTVYSRLRLGRRTFEMAVKRRSAQDAWKARARAVLATSIARFAKAASGVGPLAGKLFATMLASATMVPVAPAAPAMRVGAPFPTDVRTPSSVHRASPAAPKIVASVASPSTTLPPPRTERPRPMPGPVSTRERLEQDVRHLREAQSLLLDGDPSGALHASAAVRADGPLAEEREAIQVLSRCALADPAAAASARAFERRWPSSAALSRIAATCAFDDGAPARGH